MIVGVLANLIGLAALAGCAYALMASFMTRRFFAGRRSDPGHTDASEHPPVTILKPLCGDEPGLYENLLSFCAQDYPAPVQILFGVHGPEDSAVPVVTRLKAERPDLDITLIIDQSSHGANRKVTNLINLEPHVRHNFVVIADSDIGVGRDYLRRIHEALSAPGVGAVTCLYYGATSRSVWSRLAGMAIDLHFLPSVMVGAGLGLASPCFGSTIALERDTLARIGGLRAFANHLADDYQIGAAVTGLGLRVAIAPFVVGHACPQSSLKAMIQHELRWARTIRLLDPAGYVGSGVTHAFPLALIAAALRGFDAVGWALIGVALLSRLWLRWVVRGTLARAVGEQDAGARTRFGGAGWLLPLRDVLSFFVYLACFRTRELVWRGERLQLGKDGSLSPSPNA